MTHIRFALILLLAACVPLPPKPAAPLPPKPAETVRYQASPFSALPGWAGANLAPSLRAFQIGRASCRERVFRTV